jgi:hypothetical protein
MNMSWRLLKAAMLSAALLARSQGENPAASRLPSAQAGRPVRVVTISFQNQPFETIRNLVEGEAAKGTDIIALPETWSGQKEPRP